MPFLPLPDGAQVELIHSLGGRPLESTFWFVKHEVSAPADLAVLTSACAVWWRDWMLPHLSHELFFVANQATDVSVVGGAVVRFELDPPLRGELVTASQPANVAFRVNYSTTKVRSPTVGCLFVPGIPDDRLVINTMDAEWVRAVVEATTELVDWIEHYNWRWVVASKWLDGSLRSQAHPYRVNHTFASGRIVGQRRRRLRNEFFP